VDIIKFLTRHEHMFFGFNGTVEDDDLIGLISWELRHLNNLESFEIFLEDGFWFVCSDIDWIYDLVGEDTLRYFTEVIPSRSVPNVVFAIGGALNKYGSQAGTFLNGNCEWRNFTNSNLLKELSKKLPQNKKRAIFFNSTPKAMST